MNQLVLAGHSFGGQTAIATAGSLPEADRPKVLFALDPSLFAFCDEIIAGQHKVTCPVMCIHSEYFTHYSNMYFKQWDAVMAVMNGAKGSGRQENIIIKEQRHLDQCDAGCVVNWEK